MKSPRKPASFPVRTVPDEGQDTIENLGSRDHLRSPRAIEPEAVIATPDPFDAFDTAHGLTADPPPADPPKRRSWLGALLLSTVGALLSLAAGLWAEQLIRELFARAGFLGWIAVGLVFLSAMAMLLILTRELRALWRLGSMEQLRNRALDAILRNDSALARVVADELCSLVSEKPETAAGRETLRQLRGEIIDGANLVRLAEAEILGPLDARAKSLILDAAKRVSMVTAVSPRALVDIAYVLFESGRLVRQLAALYGGRPGMLGFYRLARAILGHLAVTGSIAVGDSFVQQVVGHGLAARLSAKLGEGVVNGMMTARIGIAAMETARPFPFTAVKRPGMGDFLAALASFASLKNEGNARRERN